MQHTFTPQSDPPHRSPAATRDEPHACTPASLAFADYRPETIAQRKLTNAIHNSPHMVAQRQQLRGMFGEAAQLTGRPEDEELLQGKFATVQRQGGPEEEELLQGKFAPVQRQGPEEEELLQGKFAPVQRQGGREDEELLQGKFATVQRQGPEEEELIQGKFAPVQRQGGHEDEELLQGKFASVQRAEAEPDRATRENKTGLPDNLKSGIESLSGMSMDNVKVHYNSAQPAQLNALAYAQGTDIHVAPGQEQHLPHEAWHVVQQAQGRVRPTMQMKDGVAVNDDHGLEHEADVMGEKGERRVQERGDHRPKNEQIQPPSSHEAKEKEGCDYSYAVTSGVNKNAAIQKVQYTTKANGKHGTKARTAFITKMTLALHHKADIDAVMGENAADPARYPTEDHIAAELELRRAPVKPAKTSKLGKWKGGAPPHPAGATGKLYKKQVTMQEKEGKVSDNAVICDAWEKTETGKGNDEYTGGDWTLTPAEVEAIMEEWREKGGTVVAPESRQYNEYNKGRILIHLNYKQNSYHANLNGTEEGGDMRDDFIEKWKDAGTIFLKKK